MGTLKTIAFFNNKGGVGKTSLVYHLSWMFAELDWNVLAVDLDPQANLTSMFLNDERLEEVWPNGEHSRTIHGVMEPILRGTGDIAEPHVELASHVSRRIGLIIGDLRLSRFEDNLSAAWPRCQSGDEAAFRTTTAFYRAIAKGAERRGADLALIDVGPNLGAINRSALIASDSVVIPLASDLFSLQGLRNLGPQLRIWGEAWIDLRRKTPNPELMLPSGAMIPAGYVVMQHPARGVRPAKAYLRWMDKIPAEYRESVLNEQPSVLTWVGDDPHCLATLKHYHSLMPLAMAARKPMFHLKPADGAIGAHSAAARDCYLDFQKLADRIAQKCGIEPGNREPMFSEAELP